MDIFLLHQYIQMYEYVFTRAPQVSFKNVQLMKGDNQPTKHYYCCSFSYFATIFSQFPSWQPFHLSCRSSSCSLHCLRCHVANKRSQHNYKFICTHKHTHTHMHACIKLYDFMKGHTCVHEDTPFNYLLLCSHYGYFCCRTYHK